MARLSRPLGLSFLFVVLLIAAVVAGRPTPPQPVYDPAGNGPDGLLLLREWLVEMDYSVAVTGQDSFAIAEADLLFVYPGVEPFSKADRDRLLGWIEAGGTLVLVDANDSELMDVFDFSTRRSGGERLVQRQPLLPEASAALTGTAFARRLRLPAHAPALTLLADDSEQTRPAAALLRQGQGWVWLLSEDFTLTNERLTESRSTAQIVPALLRSVPDGGRVYFDTYHLFGPNPDGADGIGSLQEWAYTTPTGWAALFLLVLGFGYLLLHGRRLGPPLQTIAQGRRREAAEFVVAMAGLQRRAGVRDSIARQQSHRLKQHLGRPWQLSPDVPDGEFVDRLSAADPSLDGPQLRHLLARLATASDEATLVQLAQEVELIIHARR